MIKDRCAKQAAGTSVQRMYRSRGQKTLTNLTYLIGIPCILATRARKGYSRSAYFIFHTSKSTLHWGHCTNSASYPNPISTIPLHHHPLPSKPHESDPKHLKSTILQAGSQNILPLLPAQPPIHRTPTPRSHTSQTASHPTHSAPTPPKQATYPARSP